VNDSREKHGEEDAGKSRRYKTGDTLSDSATPRLKPLATNTFCTLSVLVAS
jgi:hypothetical protein